MPVARDEESATSEYAAVMQVTPDLVFTYDGDVRIGSAAAASAVGGEVGAVVNGDVAELLGGICRRALDEQKPVSGHLKFPPTSAARPCLFKARAVGDLPDRAVVVITELAPNAEGPSALIEAEAKWKSLIDHLPSLVLTADRDGRISFINRTDSSLAVEDVVGQHIWQWVPPTFQDKLRGYLRKVFSDRASFEYEMPSVVDGRAVWYSCRVGPVIKRDEVTAAIFVALDISARKQAELAVEGKDRLLRLVVDSIKEPIFVKDSSGRYILANAATARAVGVGDLLGRSAHQIFPPDIAEAVCADDLQIIKTLQPAVFEYRLAVEPQPHIWSVYKTPYINEDGEVLGVIAIATDITEQRQQSEAMVRSKEALEQRVDERTLALSEANAALKLEIADRRRAEEKLAAETERLNVTLRSIGDGVITTDSNSRITMMNSVAERLTGWPEGAARDQPLNAVLKLVDADSREPLACPVERVLAAGQTIELDDNTLLIAWDGHERRLADSGAPIRDRNGEVIGVVLVFRDVTTQRQHEAEMIRAGKLESIGVLAGGIAHDFNNILTAITGNLSLAKAVLESDSESYEIIGQAEQAALQAAGLTKQLLTFAKGGAPVKTLSKLDELVTESVQFALRGTRSNGEFYIPNDLWLVDVDRDQINQVLVNLALNADQAMPGGGVVAVSCRNVNVDESVPLSLASGRRYVCVMVADSGVGIARAHLDQIFEPYFTTKDAGHGLGLATTYSIIRHHEGHIQVESKTGGGTTFAVYLPAAEDVVHEPAAPPELEPSLGGRILLMDDSKMILRLGERVLGRLGYEVVGVANGEAALAAYTAAQAAGEPFDTVLLDLTIVNGMGGLETMARLRELDPDVVAVVTSGYSNQPVIAEYEQHGFRAALLKPWSVTELRQVLARVATQRV